MTSVVLTLVPAEEDMAMVLRVVLAVFGAGLGGYGFLGQLLVRL